MCFRPQVMGETLLCPLRRANRNHCTNDYYTPPLNILESTGTFEFEMLAFHSRDDDVRRE
jgi:hypothetical protein